MFITAVGTAFPFYRDRFKGAEGVIGHRGLESQGEVRRARSEYYDAHVKKHQKEPDRWASAFAYASLQILERCVGEVGLDQAKIKEMLDSTEFPTVAGPIKFTKGENSRRRAWSASGRRASSRSSGRRTAATGAAVVPKTGWA